MSFEDPAVQRALTLFIDEREKRGTPEEERDRASWVKYAAAALAGVMATECEANGTFASADGRARWVADQADALLAIEKETFE